MSIYISFSDAKLLNLLTSKCKKTLTPAVFSMQTFGIENIRRMAVQKTTADIYHRHSQI